jgi:hypothetical protein
MNLDSLTIGQVKELSQFITGKSNVTEHQPDPALKFIGKTCMFRTYSAGVHFGELAEKKGQTCLVKNAQRVWYWTQACSLSQLAMEGSKNFSECKIAMPVEEMILEQVIEIIPMPDSVIKAFRGAAVWKK